MPRADWAVCSLTAAAEPGRTGRAEDGRELLRKHVRGKVSHHHSVQERNQLNHTREYVVDPAWLEYPVAVAATAGPHTVPAARATFPVV